ncbi:MAG: hypothetical protein MJK04_11005, partial [Psychrosphaera sp.]|nr:hypothetical protein [Psychrosphaera sp.]
VKLTGSNNDVDLTKIILKGEASGTRTLTTTNVDITDETNFSVTLNSADKTAVNALFFTNGTQSADSVVYNLNAAENWMAAGAPNNNIVDATSNAITVSNAASPVITSATYDYSTGNLVVTGTDFEAKSGVTNDVTANLFTFTGEAGATYILTDTADVDRDSATQFTLTLSTTDRLLVNALLNKNGTQADNGQVYNLAAADNFMANVTAGNTADLTTNAITVSSVANPVITSAIYNAGTGALVVTGTDFVSKSGVTNDVDTTKLTFTGDASGTYVLITTAVEITNSTTFTINLDAADITNLNGLLNKDGVLSDDNTTYNLAAAEDWMAGAAASNTIADLTANGVTVSGVTKPLITAATYNAGTGVLLVTGTNFVNEVGNTNDVDGTKLTLTGENGATYTLPLTNAVEITDATSFSITLTSTTKLKANGILNKDGAVSDDNTTYNLAAADNWMPGAANTTDLADTPNAINVSGVTVPQITSTTFNVTTGTLDVTGTGFVSKDGTTDDIDASKLTFTGEGGATHTLFGTAAALVTETSFSLVLHSADSPDVISLLNKNGTNADDNTLYNLAAADGWMRYAPGTVDIADATTGITVSNVAVPSITSISYYASIGQFQINGDNFVSLAGSTNDVDLTKLTFTGEGGSTYTLTTSSIERGTSGIILADLNLADTLALGELANKNGTTSNGSTTYNLAFADNWLAGVGNSVNIVNATNAVTVSSVTAPTITSATFDATSGAMVVTGASFVGQSGGTNDVDISLLTITGEGGATYTITSSSDVEVTSLTAFTVTLSGADKTNVDGLLNKNGTVSDTTSTAFNLAAADNWMTGAATSTDIADLSSNAIDVSNVTVPAITSATYDATTGTLVVMGTNLRNNDGSTNDVDISLLTLTGDNGATYAITSAVDVEISSATEFSLALIGTDKTNVDGLLNKNGTHSDVSNTVYNLAGADNWMSGAAAST